MLKSTYPFRIEWGDCDAAGITFYPNYFKWFDASSWHLFEKAGFRSKTLMETQSVFLPLVDARAQFRRPGFLGDDAVMESQVIEWRERFFVVGHRALRGDEVLLEGQELRCWAQRHPEDERRFAALPIPEDFRRALSGEVNPA